MKMIKASFPDRLTDTITKVVEDTAPIDWAIDSGYGRYEKAIEIVVADGRGQSMIEALEDVLKSTSDWRITVLPVQSTLPRPEEDPAEKTKAQTLQENLYQSVLSGCRFDINFTVLTALSAIVAALGLNMDNVAVIIGAMVIAPLLGPILAFSLGTALGDTDLLRKAAKTACAGLFIGFSTAYLISFIMPLNETSSELVDRTVFRPELAVLALASGAAAALSLSTGLSSALVGVMVAVALLPPSVASALYMGNGQYDMALGAALLLALNVICVLIAAQLVFIWKGVRAKSWWERKKARRAITISTTIWVLLLLALLVIGYQIAHEPTLLNDGLKTIMPIQ